jgi:hypothetical protein
MAAIPVLLASLVLGWLLARTLTANACTGPRWTALVFELSLGALLGPGVLSITTFLLLWMGIATPAVLIAAIVVLITGAALVCRKRASAALPQAAGPPDGFPWNWALALSVLAGGAFLLLDFYAATTAAPDGEWDAFAIWNLRARFLAAGEQSWHRAFSDEIGGGMFGSAHPGYPLMLSSFVASQWMVAGVFSRIAPAVTSLLFTFAVVGLLGASLALRRALSLGFLACLVLFASEIFVSQAAAQYSDIPLALCFLTALVLAEMAEGAPSAWLLAGSGFAAGLGVWTKNDGWPFLIALLAVLTWRHRRAAAWAVCGALPAVAVTVLMKALLVDTPEALFPRTFAELSTKLADAGRWWQIAAKFGQTLWETGPLWAHPVLLVAALAFVLGWIPPVERRARLWLMVPIGAALVAYYAIFLVTRADLRWHLDTAASRLFAQLWPASLWIAFQVLNPPATGAPADARRTRGSRRSEPARTSSTSL